VVQQKNFIQASFGCFLNVDFFKHCLNFHQLEHSPMLVDCEMKRVLKLMQLKSIFDLNSELIKAFDFFHGCVICEPSKMLDYPACKMDFESAVVDLSIKMDLLSFELH
jgi:hypothetical protein